PFVDRAGDQLLADAAFAAQQHGDVAVGDALNHLGDIPHRLALLPEEERGGLIVAYLPTKLGDLRLKASIFDSLFDRSFEGDLAKPLRIVRLDDVVHGAKIDRFDDGRRAFAARQHDDLDDRLRRLEIFQRGEPVHAGHHDVEQHDVGNVAVAGGGE